MQIEKMTYVTVHGSREGKFMTIPSANNNLAKVISSNPVFSAQKQKKGLSLPTKNGQIRQDLVQLSSQAKKAAAIGCVTSRTPSDSRIDDFKKDELMADYSRLQGGYLSDAVFGILDLDSVRDVYDECIENGMSKDEAARIYDEKLHERFGHFQEALALAMEFVPMDEDATGEVISYSDVYDENGQLKVPVKLTFEEYHKNLKDILENMMNALKDRKDDFPGLYKIYFEE
jgi:hypothetical protein